VGVIHTTALRVTGSPRPYLVHTAHLIRAGAEASVAVSGQVAHTAIAVMPITGLMSCLLGHTLVHRLRNFLTGRE
jgi:hypothetical protein